MGSIVAVIRVHLRQGYRTIFLSPFEKRDEAKQAKMEFATDKSDHLALARYNRFPWLTIELT